MGLFIEEPIEFEKSPVGVQNFGKITHHCGGMCGIYLTFIKKN